MPTPPRDWFIQHGHRDHVLYNALNRVETDAVIRGLCQRYAGRLPTQEEVNELWYDALFTDGEGSYTAMRKRAEAMWSPDPPPTIKPTRIANRAFVTDDGPYPALGATMMWLMDAVKNDPAEAERNLAWLQGFDYVRDHTISARLDINPKESGYWARQEKAFKFAEKYGLRRQLICLTDMRSFPQFDMEAHVRSVVKMANDFPHLVQGIEIANEHYHDGNRISISDLRKLGEIAKGLTNLPVTLSAPQFRPNITKAQAIEEVYAGSPVDFAVIHNERREGDEGKWRPVRQPRHYLLAQYVPSAHSNNEPIGPRSSGTQDTNKARIVSGYINTFMCLGCAYVFHSKVGAFGDRDFSEEDNAEAIKNGLLWARQTIDPAISGGVFKNTNDSGYPLRGIERRSVTGKGIVRAYASVFPSKAYVFPFGIIDSVRLKPTNEWSKMKVYAVAGQRVIYDGVAQDVSISEAARSVYVELLK